MSIKTKYRAWHKEQKRMLEVDSLCFSLNKIMCKYPEYKDFIWEDANKFIVLQYVGFNDINNKEIYAGDIDEYGYVVTYLANLNEGLGMNAGWYLQRDNFESWSELVCDEDIEIIGNVFENPGKANNNCNTNYIKLF